MYIYICIYICIYIYIYVYINYIDILFMNSARLSISHDADTVSIVT